MAVALSYVWWDISGRENWIEKILAVYPEVKFVENTNCVDIFAQGERIVLSAPNGSTVSFSKDIFDAKKWMMLTQFVANNGVKQDKAGEVVASATSRKRGDIPSWEQAKSKWEWIIASKLIKPRVTPWRELDRTTTESTTPEVIMAIYRDDLAKKNKSL